MRIDLERIPRSGEPPAEIEIAAIEPEHDLPAVKSLFDEAFRGEWGYHEVPFEEWSDARVEAPCYDPSLWLLATEAGERSARSRGGSGDRGWVSNSASDRRGAAAGSARRCCAARSCPSPIAGCPA